MRVAKQRKPECALAAGAEECPVWSVFFNQASDLDRWRYENLELALLRQISKGHAVMVDSSKTAWNHAAAPFRFGRKLGQDSVLVHMVRDPRGVCWSLIKRNERVRKPANDHLALHLDCPGLVLCQSRLRVVQLDLPESISTRPIRGFLSVQRIAC